MINFNSKNFKSKNWGVLYYVEDDINNLIDAEIKLIANSENYSKKLIEEFRTKIKDDSELQTKPTNYEERSYKSQYYRNFYGDSEKLIKQILQNHRKASLLSAFSIMEGQLKLISKIIEDEFDITLNDIRLNDYIERYWIFFTERFKIESKVLENNYKAIKQHKFIRNKIAHNNSEIKNTDIPFIQKTKGLRIKRFGEDYIVEIENDKYISERLNTIKIFFNVLIKEIDNRYGEIKMLGNSE